MGLRLRQFHLTRNRAGRGPDQMRLLELLFELEESGRPVWKSDLIRSIGSVNRKPGSMSGYLRRFAGANGLRFRTKLYVREHRNGTETEDLKLWVEKKS